MDNIHNKNLLDSVLSSSASDTDSKTLADAVKKGDRNTLINSLSKEDKEKLNAVLNDKQALSDALKTPQAKAIIKALFGGKNG